VRLKEAEVLSLIAVVEKTVGEGPYEFYLYGSRTRDELKGGDIDLLLLVDPAEADQLNRERHVILRKMKDRIGDRKIDLTISFRKEAEQDAFLSEALSSAVSLSRRAKQ
jgi:predicted nucleotidyltransferase